MLAKRPETADDCGDRTLVNTVAGRTPEECATSLTYEIQRTRDALGEIL